MTRTRTTDTWAIHALASIGICLAIRYLILPELWDGLGEVWIVPITLGVIPVAEVFGLSEDIVLSITNPVSPLLIPWGIGIASVNKTVSFFQERRGW